jgi:hypothetical protein
MQLMTQVAHLEAFIHVVEDLFLLQQGNVIWQALLDLWGTSNNPCMIYVPLHALQINYGATSGAQPLSNAYKNQITHFQNMYDHCSCQIAWSDCNIFDLMSSNFDSYTSATFMPLHLCSCTSSNPSGLTKVF